MDIWFYYDVTHSGHVYYNPVSKSGVRELETVLELDAGRNVLDIACGMGEMLVGFAERRGIRGAGVDISPHALRRAREKKEARVPGADLTFLEMDGKDYRPGPGETFDVAMCIGASWIWGGFEGTLRALRSFARPGGLVVCGEPFFRKEPPPEYLEAEGFDRDTFFTLPENLAIAERLGLGLVWFRGSPEEEWDRYEMLQVVAVDRFRRENPDHPDLPEILKRHEPAPRNYLRWGRDCLGFALWVFRTPETFRTPTKHR